MSGQIPRLRGQITPAEHQVTEASAEAFAESGHDSDAYRPRWILARSEAFWTMRTDYWASCERFEIASARIISMRLLLRNRGYLGVAVCAGLILPVV